MKHLSIQDLCDQTGVTRRTIYFYIQQKILPPPSGAGLSTYYTDEHLLRLKLIPILRNQGLRLDDIRTTFQNATIKELQAKLEMYPVMQQIPASFIPKADTILSYQLPNGIQLLVPAVQTQTSRRKVELLLEFVQSLFSDLPTTPHKGGLHHV